MIALLWLRGTLSGRSLRLLGVAVGIALTVGLLASLGAFIASSAGSMTSRAIAAVPVDWQVQLQPGVAADTVIPFLQQPGQTTAAEPVGYADTPGLSATTGATTQTTGPGRILGLGPGYRQQFPSELRPLVGAPDGVLVAQQTAANLHMAPGDTVSIQRPGLPPVTVQVDGVVDLPFADSLFQAVGIPAGSAPQAPPDNVLLLPMDRWHALFDSQASLHPETVQIQLHVRLPHNLPSDPGAAYTAVQSRARHVEARLAGDVRVADNLAARLDGVRADALYARVLFLFLGLPGAILGILLTFAVATTGADRRRREQALLRTRGATTAHLLRLAGIEAVLAGSVGVVLGGTLAAVATRTLVGVSLEVTTTTLTWWGGAAVLGLVVAFAAVLTPAWQQARRPQWQAGRTIVGRAGTPPWQRLYLDLVLLGIAAVAFWQVARSGYQVVLAPEGVPQASVAYQAFLAPVCLWLGAGLLVMRLSALSLTRGRSALARLLRPLARRLAGTVAAALAHQHRAITRGVVLVALAVAFALSTAMFDTTYNAQAGIDAALTNGADVTVTGTIAAPAGARLAALEVLPGVAGAQPLQHRFAYVGADLQDLYGIDARGLGSVARLADAFFAGGNARATLAALAARPDGVLVSAETARDFQLQPGDQLQLRLQHAGDQQYHAVPFHFVGIVREFPTAPKDSFLVANAGYVAQQTGIATAEVVLLRSSGSPVVVAARARTVVNDIGAQVTDITGTRQAVASGLTAVDLRGLTRVELGFALLVAIGATGLVLALSVAERRRTFAVLAALGARPHQIGAFLWGEGLVVLVGGALSGVLIGVAVAEVLVRLLTGVFDPPPAVLVVPWGYLVLLALVAGAATASAVVGARLVAQRAVVETLRDF